MLDPVFTEVEERCSVRHNEECSNLMFISLNKVTVMNGTLRSISFWTERCILEKRADIKVENKCYLCFLEN